MKLVARRTAAIPTLALAAMVFLSLAPASADAMPRAKYEVTVFSDDAALAKRVLSKLQGMGYTNPGNEVLDDPNDDLNIKFAKDCPKELVAELAGAVEPMIGGTLNRMEIFDAGDTDLFINLPSAQVKAPATGKVERSKWVVKVFTDEPAMGKAALTALKAVGYTNPDNVIREMPNKDFNIKWGAAPQAVIDEIAGVIEPMTSAKLKRLHIFEPADQEIFINLPMSKKRSGMMDRAAFEVTVFSDHKPTGQRVIKMLAKMGYTNPGNEVLDEPNQEFNIKWGGAPAQIVDELSGIVGPMFQKELRKSHEFKPDDKDIFINLPVCSKGGAAKPADCP